MRDIKNRKRKEPDNDSLNISSLFSNILGRIIKVEINFHEEPETPPPQKILKNIPKSFINPLIKAPEDKPNEYSANVVRFKAPGPSSLQSNHVPSSSPPPAQMRRTSSSPPQRTSSSQSNDGLYSSQQPNKKQKTDHNPVDSELEILLIKEKHRIRQASLGSENIRKLAESFFKQPQINVPTNPTIEEINRKKAIESNEEEKRIKGIEERYPGASREILLEVYPKPPKNSEVDAHQRRIKEEILRRRAKKGGLKGHDSIEKYINNNWNKVSQELVNYVGLYGFDGAIKSQMKNPSRNMTTEKAPSNRGAGRGGGRGRY
jgi:hypothetical protein